MRARFAFLFSLALVIPRPAWAQPSAGDKAAAEALFDAGRNLMKSGDAKAACEKFADSQRLDPGVGTMLYLGDCYEQTGRLASAWATFREAHSMARASGQDDRAKLAQDRAAALEPRLPRLTIKAGEQAGTTIRHDGTEVPPSLVGTATPVDAGTHTLVISAAGFKEKTITFEVAAGEQKVIESPSLEPDAPAPAPTPAPPPEVAAKPEASAPPPPSRTRLSTQRKVALGVGGLGLVGLGVSAVMGLRAASAWSDAQDNCPNDRCTPTGRSAANDAESAARVSTISSIAGLALVGGAAVLWFTGRDAPQKTGSRTSVTPVIGVGGAGVVGTF